MLLERLDIQNFRVFYGAHTIDFASEPGKSVTVFYGENGAGKTTLLNAIHWCLTGNFTPGFQNKEVMNNINAASEGDTESFVELWFKHEEERYRLKRGVEFGKTIFRLSTIEADGNFKPLDASPEKTIQKMIPKELIRWFFYDAEAIGAFKLNGGIQFKKDLREALGFKVIDILVEDLEKALSIKNKQVDVSTNDKGLKAIHKNIENKEAVLPNLVIKETEAEEELEKVNTQISENDSNLSLQPQISSIQNSRLSLEKRRNNLKDDLRNKQKNIISLIASAAVPVILKKKSDELEKTLQDKEVQGKIPSPYSDQLVNDILNSKTCICGRPVGHDSKEEEKIKALLEFANTSELNSRINEMRYLFRDGDNICFEFTKKLSILRGEYSQIDMNLAETESELKDITEKINSVDQSEVKRLEQLRVSLRIKHSEIYSTKKETSTLIHTLRKDISDLKIQYDREARKIGVNVKLQKEIDKINKLKDFVSTRSIAREKQVLNVLGSELNLALKKYFSKNFSAKIDKDTYKVNLIDDEGNAVSGESTGEGQLLKFSFISMLIAIAAKKTKEKIDFLVDPTIAPLVLDAPLSTLDKDYRNAIIENLATNVDQLVLMGSSSAWGDDVQRALKNYLGKQYLIISRAKGPQGDKPLKTFIINDQVYELNEYDSERNDSYIKELSI